MKLIQDLCRVRNDPGFSSMNQQRKRLKPKALDQFVQEKLMLSLASQQMSVHLSQENVFTNGFAEEAPEVQKGR